MNIVHIITSIDISKGGPPKSVSDLAINQAMQGHKVTIFTTKSPNPFLKKSIHPNLNLIFVEGLFQKALSKFILKEKVDIMHGHDLWQLPIHYMSKLGRKYNIPYIITPRGTLEPWPLNSKKCKKKLALFLYQRFDIEKASCIHATAMMEVKNIRKLNFINQIALISNGIDVSEFNNYKKITTSNKKTILFLSRISRKKGIEILIDAWCKIDKSLRNAWKIEIAGNGEDDYINSLNDKIIANGLDGEIRIIGPQFGNDKKSTYQRADLFILPSYSENFGIVIAEALAFKIPVITTKGTPWEDLNISNSGWWIDIGIDPLVEILKIALNTTEDERIAMGINGRKLIENKYSIQSVASKTIDLYKWILEEKNEKSKPDFIY